MERDKLADLGDAVHRGIQPSGSGRRHVLLAEDAVYDEFNGTVNRGTAAIRAAFVPQFRGDYGKLRFHAEDLSSTAAAGKALIRWLCTLETKKGPAGWRGLDILHVENGRITEKLTYAKARCRCWRKSQ